MRRGLGFRPRASQRVDTTTPRTRSSSLTQPLLSDDFLTSSLPLSARERAESSGAFSSFSRGASHNAAAPPTEHEYHRVHHHHHHTHVDDPDSPYRTRLYTGSSHSSSADPMAFSRARAGSWKGPEIEFASALPRMHATASPAPGAHMPLRLHYTPIYTTCIPIYTKPSFPYIPLSPS